MLTQEGVTSNFKHNLCTNIRHFEEYYIRIILSTKWHVLTHLVKFFHPPVA